MSSRKPDRRPAVPARTLNKFTEERNADRNRSEAHEHHRVIRSLYQINTRVWLTELSQKLGRPATLDDIPDAELDRLAEMGFDWVWFLSVWQTGPAAQQVSRTQSRVAPRIPGDAAGPARGGHRRLRFRDHRLHGAPESRRRRRAGPAARAAPQARPATDARFRPQPHGARSSLGRGSPRAFHPAAPSSTWPERPQNYTWVKRKAGDLLLAYGRDPYFAGWPDTLQLNYANPATQEAMIGELVRIAGQCDGVRCDMAMLVLPDVFERTWGQRAPLFWPTATQRVRERVPGFLFMAEVYWDLEWTLQQQGFDYAYDKRLYDRLRERPRPAGARAFPRGPRLPGQAGPLPGEPRRAAGRGDVSRRRFTRPRRSSRFCPRGCDSSTRASSRAGRNGSRRTSSRPGRARRSGAASVLRPALAVLRQPVVRDGEWQLLECAPAWDGNWTNDCFVVFGWQGAEDERLLVAVNYAPTRASVTSGCRSRISPARPGCCRIRSAPTAYERDGDELQSQGLFVDLRPWQASVFALHNQFDAPSGR